MSASFYNLNNGGTPPTPSDSVSANPDQQSGSSFFQVDNPTPEAMNTAADLLAATTEQAVSAASSASAAASSASAAASSASAASTSASAASTSASAASTSATSAETQATNAAASASAASTSASTAGTQATNAASSASAAAASAAAASTSATSAASSSTNATNKLAQFTNIYYGPLASNPTTRPDSSAMVSGDMYYSTTSLVMMVYNGTSWAAVASGGELYAANNLSDVANSATALSNLGGFPTAGGQITGNVGVKSAPVSGVALSVGEAVGTKTNMLVSSTMSGTPRHLQVGSDGDVGAHFGLRASNGLAFADAGDIIPISIDSNGLTSAVTNTIPLGRLAFRFHSFYCNSFYVTSSGAVFETVAPTFEALTGYMKANGLSAATASTTIPTSDLSGTISAGQLASGAAVSNIGYTPLNPANNLSDVASALTARGNLGAASVQALAAAGIQINGDMEVSQWAGSGLLSAINGYAIDGWQVSQSGAMVVSAQQVTDSPTGYSNSLKVSVTTADTSMDATDFLVVHQLIEGVRCRKVGFGAAGANYASVAFWFKSTQIGIYGVFIRNGVANRSQVQNITYGTANVWQRFTLEFTGDTTGTWATDTTAGLDLGITLACGTNFQGTTGSWFANGNVGSSSQTNGASSNTNTFQVTGVQLIAGRGLPSDTDAPICRRSFDEELRICKRYYEHSYNYGTTPGSGALSPNTHVTDGANAYATIPCPFEVEKRTAPTVVFFSPVTGASGKIHNYNGATDVNATNNGITTKGLTARVDGVSLAAATSIGVHWSASAFL